jgi:hypothetical protein
LFSVSRNYQVRPDPDHVLRAVRAFEGVRL